MDLGKYSVEPNTDPMTMTIEVTKDYTLTLINNSSKATSFRVGFELLNANATPKTKAMKPTHIKLPKGEQVANLKGTLGPKASKNLRPMSSRGI